VGGRCHDTVGRRLCLHHLKLYGTHTTASEEEITLAEGAICLQEVGLQVDIEKASRQTLHRVVDGKHVDSLAILDIGARVNADDITDTHTQIATDHTVHSNLSISTLVVGQDNANCLSLALAFDNNCVAAENIQLIQLGLAAVTGEDARVGGKTTLTISRAEYTPGSL
jgi:hypothetical protein